MSIYTTLFVPLRRVDPDAAVAAGWQPGPLVTGRSRYQMPTLDQRRTQFYVNRSPLEDLLDGRNRAHLQLSRFVVGSWVVDAIEVVRARSLEFTSAPEVVGYLLVHLAQRADSREVASLSQLGEFVRPERKASRELLASLRPPQVGDRPAL